MIERVMRSALHNRMAVLLLVALVAVGGILALHGMPMDAFPDVTSNQVEVICTSPGMAPPEVERFVTVPVETAMRGLPGLKNMRSTTKYGLAVLTLVFEDRLDIYFVRSQVFQRLAAAREKLPPGAETEMGPVATAMGEIFQYTLATELPANPEERVRKLTDLRTLQDWVVSPLLKGVSGVNEVNTFGGYIKQYEVEVDPAGMESYGLTATDVAAALRAGNTNAGGGVVERGPEQFLIRGEGMFRGVKDIGDVVLKAPGGVPVCVRDVASVRESHAPRQGLALKDGRGETVGGIVMMLRGENSLDVVERVADKVREINSSGMLPEGVRIQPYYERSQIVGSSVRTVARTLAEGAILVVIVLVILLRSVRGALIVLAALPLSLLLTFTVMRTVGLEANLMSLGGLAISIGMIIDATIIQVENVQRHLAEAGRGVKRLPVVLKAVLEVRKPSIFGELIIALTFVPILALQGMEGKMFAPLAYTVAIALFASLFLSVFVIPALCGLILKPGQEKESPVVRGVKRLYEPLLRLSLRGRVAVALVSLLLVIGAFLLVPTLGTEFMPVMDEGAFDMDIQMLPGVSLPEAGRIIQEVQKRLMTFPELTTVVSRTGQTGIDLEASGVNQTAFVGAMRPRSEWRQVASREALFDQMREKLSDIPGMAFSFSQPIQCRIDELVAGTRAQISVRIFGEDMAQLRRCSDDIARVLSGVRGAKDVVPESVAGQPQLTIRIDRARLARYGLSAGDVLGLVDLAVGGRSVTDIYEANRSFGLCVRVPERYRQSPEALSALRVGIGEGRTMPLGELADIRLEEGPVQVSRVDGARCMGVELNVSGRDIGSFVAEAQQRIRQKIRLPEGTYLKWGGQFENQQQAMRRLSIIAPVVLALVVLLLYISFGNLRLAALVLLNLPFALVGGVVALKISGLYLSVPASVGFIVLLGLAVLNGLVLVARVTQLRGEGCTQEEALRKGCESRLRPILMTASITVFSLLPMLMATGPGAEVQRPLAWVVVGGLMTSTLSTLLVLPALYAWFERRVAPSSTEEE